jgi:hypothetical protein
MHLNEQIHKVFVSYLKSFDGYVVFALGIISCEEKNSFVFWINA